MQGRHVDTPDQIERPRRTEAPSRPKQPSRSSVLADWTRALAATAAMDAQPDRTLAVVVADIAAVCPDAPALLSDRESFTYAELDDRADRIARWAEHEGLQSGDVVALLMENRPEYVAIWLGLTRVGIVVALLNTHLTGAALAHCCDAAAPKAAIVSEPFVAIWQSAVSANQTAPVLWTHGVALPGICCLDDALRDPGAGPLMRQPVVALRDRALLIYTSGTTGLPKAAVVSHRRLLSWALWFGGLLDVGPADRMYDCLPLYHSVGGVVAVGALLARGGSVVIAPSFSASNFWADVRRWDCTLAQYIGELCRYLLKNDSVSDARGHRLRAMCGNGLRGDVWQAFQARFEIPRILEFYAASEGTFSLYNVEGEPGAIGRVPAFLSHRFPAAIVLHDDATGVPARDDEGRCISAPRGSVGEAIGRVATRAGFEGYTDAKATDGKLLHDVFEPGDLWVRTGDLMRMDARGFWYFVDRVGDTFRWKGENVSTLEVANAVTRCPGVVDAAVYGVAVPGCDGRAGMAAIRIEPAFEIDRLAQHVAASLPTYARPLFVRISQTLELTGTFKHRAQALAQDGFDPRRIGEPLYMLNAKGGGYVPLDPRLYDDVVSGQQHV